MPLESATYISDLNASNPVGSTDKVQTLDDHVRLIKSTVKATFPNVTGAVTATQAELNLLDGVTASTAELNILDGVTLTAAQINEAARLSAINTFTTTNTFTGAGGIAIASTLPTFLFNETDADADEKLWRMRTSAGAWRLDVYTDAGAFVGGAIVVDRNATTVTEVELNATTFDLNGNLDLSGTVSSPGSSAAEVGYNGAPQNVQDGNYTLVLADRGKTIYKSAGGAGETITIPANGTVPLPVGTIIRIVNNGGGDLTIAITTDTLSLAGAGTTGSRTLSDHGVAVIEKVASTEWFISGVGLS